MKLMLGLFFILLLVSGLAFLIVNSRAVTESPAYRVVRVDGRFEIREYPNLQLAQTGMTSSMDGSFMRLFRYISGQNERDEKIAMTTPVLMNRRAGQGSMSFIVPKATEEKGVPQPKASEVRVQTFAGGRYAVHRFKGNAKGGQEAEAVARLEAWCLAQQSATEGEPLFAYYDPPWTPDFLTRNEVLWRLKP